MKWCEAARRMVKWNLVVCVLCGVVGIWYGSCGCFWFMVYCAAGGFALVPLEQVSIDLWLCVIMGSDSFCCSSCI
jgi:hypothetical protein